MSARERKAYAAALRAENARQPVMLTAIPRDRWPTTLRDAPQIAVYRSKTLLAQLFDVGDGVLRLSVNRTTMRTDGRWDDGLTWDDLMRAKREAGLAGSWAVEVFPPDSEIVNVANMRHLFLLPEAPDYAWRRQDVIELELASHAAPQNVDG